MSKAIEEVYAALKRSFQGSLLRPDDGEYPALGELADLPIGWYAERTKVGEPRVRKQHSSDDRTE